MKKDSISIILNVYKRPQTLEPQIQAIKNQSIKIKSEDIHVWYNSVEFNGNDRIQHLKEYNQEFPRDENIKWYDCSWNTKFYGRFTIPLLIDTEFVCFIDDDILIGKDWISNCLNSFKEHQGIYGGSEVILQSRDRYYSNIKVGWNGAHFDTSTEVDLVGHSIFLQTEWVKIFWLQEPYTRDNGEDIHLSYSLQKHLGIKTFVPKHPENDKSLWSCDPSFGFDHGNDKNATWLHSKNHNSIRDEIVKNYVSDGWKLVNF